MNKADAGMKHFDKSRLGYLRQRLGRAENIDQLFQVSGEAVHELLSLEPVLENSWWNSRILWWSEWTILLTGSMLTIAMRALWQEIKGVMRSVCRTTVPRAHGDATGKSKMKDGGAVSSVKEEVDTLMKLKQKELSELCKARGFAGSGTKEVLASRLVHSFFG